MKKIVIINFTGLRGNWGCQATSFELLRFISTLYPVEERLKIDIVPLLATGSVDAEGDREIDRVYDSFQAVADGGDEAALSFLTDLATRRYGKWVPSVKEADLVVFQAEGSMGMGDDFAKGPRLMLLPFVAKHAWGRKVIALNQTFYSHNQKVIDNAVATFSTLDFTAFRESASVALARQSGLENACLVPDLAFMARSWDHAPAEVEPTRFAVTGSALKDPQRYPLIIEQTRAIARQTGLKPLIAVSRDYQLTVASYTQFSRGQVERLSRKETYNSVTKHLAHSAFLLGGRYHMSIMAAAAGTPNILLTGNSFKTEGLADLLKSPRPVRQFQDTKSVVADAVAILENIDEERARVRQQVGILREIIERARVHIASIIRDETPHPFQDRYPRFLLDSDKHLDRYRKYGSGKRKKRSALQLKLTDLAESLSKRDQGDAIGAVIKDCIDGGDQDFAHIQRKLN